MDEAEDSVVVREVLVVVREVLVVVREVLVVAREDLGVAVAAGDVAVDRVAEAHSHPERTWIISWMLICPKQKTTWMQNLMHI